MMVEIIYVGVYPSDVGFKVGEVFPKVISCGSYVNYCFLSVTLIATHLQVFLALYIFSILSKSSGVILR